MWTATRWISVCLLMLRQVLQPNTLIAAGTLASLPSFYGSPYAHKFWIHACKDNLCICKAYHLEIIGELPPVSIQGAVGLIEPYKPIF